MKATGQLKEEHQGILLMLKILEKICQKLESGEKVDPEHLEGILGFFRIFVDKCHHGKEEDLLFVAMEEAGIPREQGPIGVMLAEHGMGRESVAGMNSALTGYKAGDPHDAFKIVENARKVIALLRRHIEKEDNILYPMADRQLPAPKQEELYEEFEKLEKERIGIGKHEEFHRLLHDLQKIYLS